MEDELEPVPDGIAAVMKDEEERRQAEWEDECIRRVPELDDLEYREFFRWCFFLESLAAMSAEDIADELEECEYFLDGRGWLEDTHGGAVFVPWDIPTME